MDEEERSKIDQAKEKAAETKQAIQSGAKIASKAASGDYIGAAKEALKNGAIKKKIKRAIIMGIIKMLVPLMIIVALASAVLGIFDKIKEQEISLKASMGSIKTGFFSKLWKRITNDYWIDLNDDESFKTYLVSTVDGKTVAYRDENNEIAIFNKDDLNSLAQYYYKKSPYDLEPDQLKTITNEYIGDLQSKGKIKEKKYNIVDAYIKDLGDQGISVKDLKLLGNADYDINTNLINNEDEQNSENKKKVEKYISEFIRADIITQSLHRRHGTSQSDLAKVKDDDQNQIDGAIYLYRTNNKAAINATPADFDMHDNYATTQDEYYKVEYLPYGEEGGDQFNTFSRLITTNDKDAKKYFSIKEVDGEEQLVIAQVSRTVTSNDDQAATDLEAGFDDIKNKPVVGNNQGDYTVQEVVIPYKEYVAKYAMPYEFLINLCQVTQNPEFVYHLATLARDTEIVLTIYDDINVTKDVTQTYTKECYFKNKVDDTIPDEPDSVEENKTTRIRTTTTTITEVPTLKVEYADSWDYYDEYEYFKNMEGTISNNKVDTTPEKPERLRNHHEEQLDINNNVIEEEYWDDKFITEQYTESQSINVDVKYEAVTDGPTKSIRKSKQFLGLLRNNNEEQECWYDCYEDAATDHEPTALYCARDARFDINGKNVKYLIPGTNQKEAPLNKLMSGLQMLYSIMTSNNGSVYKANDKLVNTDQLYEGQKEFLSKNDYESAYIVSMQEIVEYLKLTFPKPYHYGDVEDYENMYVKKWDLVGGAGGTPDPAPTPVPTPIGGEVPISQGEYIWPINDSNPEAKISSKFGPRKAPKAGASTNHGGIDLAVPVKTPVYATAEGKVTFAGNANKAGIMVTIDHQNGMVSKYMHLNSYRVSPGEIVKQGDLIAYSGNTGNSTGPHLHFQMELNGTKVDPLIYLKGKAGDVNPTPAEPHPVTDAQKLDVICAIVMQEAGNKYDGALAVMSLFLNRCESPRWKAYGGNDVYKQMTFKGQSSYSNDGYYKKYLNGNYTETVKKAVDDAINKGKRNHKYTCCRTDTDYYRRIHPNGIPIDGNWFFD